MPSRSTSFRLDETMLARLQERAAAQGTSATALLERLVVEGLDVLDHPGVVHRGPPADRRAALAAGPDVWEVVARLRELDGAEEQRIATLAQETDLHPRDVRRALEYAAHHAEDVQRRIDRRDRAVEVDRHAAEQRRALLA